MVGFVLFLSVPQSQVLGQVHMTTCIVLIGIFLCLVVGIPIGIAMARNPR
ncbi:MAG: hypothetical protein CM1200mP30_15350 [Pseudomonadota bacterium]|nr:MAG: hypothetical protein CM1200mP30_15350 [Pseudomonadota bacterium]